MKRSRRLCQTSLLALSCTINAAFIFQAPSNKCPLSVHLPLQANKKESENSGTGPKETNTHVGFLGFFSSSDQSVNKPTPPKEKKDEGRLFGLFRRTDKETKEQRRITEEQRKEEKRRVRTERKTEQKRKREQQQQQKEEPSKRTVLAKKQTRQQQQQKQLVNQTLKQQPKQQQPKQAQGSVTVSEEQGDPNIFSRAQNYVGSVFASADDKQPSDDKEKASSTNPFSAAQRWISSAFSREEETWVPVFPKTRLSPGEIVPATVGGLDLLVIASKDGRRLYCLANSCSHLGTPLETGALVRLPAEAEDATSGDRDGAGSITETDVSMLLQQDGLEDCIVCPLHRTAFALKSGEVRGEWCPYPPVVGKLVGTVKQPTGVATFDIRTRGKQIEVRLNSPLLEDR